MGKLSDGFFTKRWTEYGELAFVSSGVSSLLIAPSPSKASAPFSEVVVQLLFAPERNSQAKYRLVSQRRRDDKKRILHVYVYNNVHVD